MPFTYTAEQWLPYPLEVVFAFFADPANLPRLIPAWQAARIDRSALTQPPPHPIPTERIPGTAAGAGTTLTLSFRPFPLAPFRLRWDAEISEFAWNDHFCDIQLKRGPFASWNHCHRLRRESRPGLRRTLVPGTLLSDVVHYDPPFGFVGRLAQPAIALQLRYMFGYRHRQTARLLAATRA